MIARRNSQLLVEPPAVATGDIAFNLIVFFLVCASQQPSSGRQQIIPQADAKQQQQEQSQNLSVEVNKTLLTINGNKVKDADFASRLHTQLLGKKRPEDKVVVVKTAKDVPYQRWIQVTSWIEDAGGTITLQLEEEKTVMTN